MQVWLGVDVACVSWHEASLVDTTGKLLWTRRFPTRSDRLDWLWGRVTVIAGDDPVTVIMEPTRNAWVPLAGWLRARGATVRLVPPEQSADLRDYYNKHTKTDRLDSVLLARMPLLHPDGMVDTPGLGPADTLRRAAARRASLVARRTAGYQRLEALLEILSPWWSGVLGTEPGKTALAVLARYADPQALLRLGRARLARLLIRNSRGQWREEKADELLAAARETLRLWDHGGLDFAELAEDIAAEARLAQQLTCEIDAIDDRIAVAYQQADPTGIVASAPGVGPTLAPAILGRLGDARRFRDLAAVRAYSGLVPRVDQSGTVDRRGGLTKAGDATLRAALFQAADHARKADPTLARRYQSLLASGKHHNSALCTIGAVLLTRIAACWRTQTHYQIRDLDGSPLTVDQARIKAAELSAAHTGTGRRQQESQRAPLTDPLAHHATPHASTGRRADLGGRAAS